VADGLGARSYSTGVHRQRHLCRADLIHAQVVSAQAVVQAAGDRASRFRANGRRRRHGPARPLDRSLLKRKRNVFYPVNGWSLRPMFRRQPITQIILLAKVINIHAHAQLQLTNASDWTRKPIQLLGCCSNTLPNSIVISLITRLSSWFEIHGSVLNWFKSYLSSRTFLVKCDNYFSSSYVESLVPLLFIMYTSPLSTLISSLSLNHHLYADDTQLFLSFRPPYFDSSVNYSSSQCSATHILLDD